MLMLCCHLALPGRLTRGFSNRHQGTSNTDHPSKEFIWDSVKKMMNAMYAGQSDDVKVNGSCAMAAVERAHGSIADRTLA